MSQKNIFGQTLVALVTPMTADGEVACDAVWGAGELRVHVAHLEGLGGFDDGVGGAGGPARTPR